MTVIGQKHHNSTCLRHLCHLSVLTQFGTSCSRTSFLCGLNRNVRRWIYLCSLSASLSAPFSLSEAVPAESGFLLSPSPGVLSLQNTSSPQPLSCSCLVWFLQLLQIELQKKNVAVHWSILQICRNLQHTKLLSTFRLLTRLAPYHLLWLAATGLAVSGTERYFPSPAIWELSTGNARN